VNIKKITLFFVVLAVLVFFVLNFLIPAPPKKLVMVTGSQSGAYYSVGMMFKKELAQYGITLDVRETSGSLENLALISEKNSGVDLALMQSGSGGADAYPGIESLASLFNEPLWIAYNPAAFSDLGHDPQSIADLKNKKISVGRPGSGSFQLNEAILQLNEISISNQNFIQLNNDDAFAALKRGDIDALMIVLAPDAELSQKIINDPTIALMSIEQAYGYPGRLSYVKPLLIMPGVLSIAKGLPASQKLTIAPVAELVSKKDLNPATIYLLMKISKKYFSKPGMLRAENEFPANAGLSFSLNEDADNYLKSGPSFLFQYLPFWVAVWVERMLKLSVPLLAILIPLFNLIPSISDYRKKLRFANIYRDLKMIEQGMSDHQDQLKLSNQLIDIDQRAKELKVSDFHTKDIYDLRMHIEAVRARLMTNT
jgi:hypothetical protein